MVVTERGNGILFKVGEVKAFLYAEENDLVKRGKLMT